MDLKLFILTFTFWQSLYFLIAQITSILLPQNHLPHLPPRKRAIFKIQLPSYIVSTFHALLVTSRGLHHLYILHSAPTPTKLLLTPSDPTNHPYGAETSSVIITNAILAGYLLGDLLHVLHHHPHLGTIDTILHHAAFLICAIVAGIHGLFPHTFSWLIIGEASTPLLNTRWLLIKLGKGSTSIFRVIEVAFVAVFIITRFFVYSIGLAHHLYTMGQTPAHVPLWARIVPTAFVIGGFFLNLLWISRMYKLARSPAKRMADARASASVEHERPKAE